MTNIFNQCLQMVENAGADPVWAARWTAILLGSASVLLACGAYALLTSFVNPLINKITRHTATKVDDILLRDNFLRWCWWLMATLLLRELIPFALGPFEGVKLWIDTMLDVLLIGFATKVVVEFIKGAFLIIFDKENVEEEAMKMHMAEEQDEEYEYIPSHSLKGLQQMICILVVCIGVVLMVSVVFGKNPLLIVSGLGAGAAVLMLVFRDSILGVVAGIQLTMNDMLRPGDWIVAPKFGANGRVREVTLATVKVLNWDHTIVTIPPYNLISDSFQNFRHMEETGGRRVMRSFCIDMTTVRFLTRKERERMSTEPWAVGLDWNSNVVNLTAFRRYLEHCILSQPTLREKMLFMVRELEPTPQGLPLEIYFFTSKTKWKAYEAVQADVMDHVLAVVGEFGLALFQAPTGADVRESAKRRKEELYQDPA